MRGGAYGGRLRLPGSGGWGSFQVMDKRVMSVTRRRLRDAPDSGLSACGTPEERLALVATLTHEAWALAGLALPECDRASWPITIRSLDGTPLPGKR